MKQQLGKKSVTSDINMRCMCSTKFNQVFYIKINPLDVPDRKSTDWLHVENQVKHKMQNKKSQGVNTFLYSTHAVFMALCLT